MENISKSSLELTEFRKENLRRTLQRVQNSASSILLLTVQWKELEEHFDNTKSFIEERSKELLAFQETIEERFSKVQEQEKKLKSDQDSVKEREKKLGVVQESIEERFREVEVIQLSQKLDVEKQRKAIEWIQESSKELTLVRETLEKKLLELEVKVEEFVSIKRSIDDRFKELQLREEMFEKLKHERFEQWSKDFELKENQFMQEFKQKEKRYEECCNEFKLKEKQFELRSKEIELKGKKYEKLFKEVELKDKKLQERFKELELKEKQFEERSKEVELKDKKFEKRCKELELKEKRVEESSKEVEMKEKRYANSLHTQVKTEPEENILVNNASTCANIKLCITMDGKCLQIFLNERWKEHDSMQNEVLFALQLSSDPAKLVLDAMQGFYPPHLKEEFEETVIRSTCILLLEQLMKLSPDIKPKVKGEAMKLAFDWITKMRVNVGHSLEVLGFLQLLATYGLAHAFDADELLNYLEIVAEHSQAPKLFRVLGFADKIYGFIQNLIVKKQQFKAIKFIYAFELVGHFPPVPLLKNYLNRSERDALKLYKIGNKSLQAQSEARNKRLADVKAVIKCIEDHKLESEYPHDHLKRLVASWENPNANCQLTTPALGPKTPSNPSKQQSGSKRPWTAESFEASSNASNNATSNVPSVQMTCQQPKGLNFNQDFIQNLIKREQRLDAIKYMYAWNMVDKFPPLHLLNDHLIYSKKNAEEFCKRNKNSIPAQIGAIKKEMSALRDIIKCIEDYKIEPEFSPKILEELIVELEKKKAEIQAKIGLLQQEEKCNAPTSAPSASSSPSVPGPTKITTPAPTPATVPETKLQQESASASSSPTVPALTKVTPAPTAAPTPATVPETKPQQESGNKRPRIAVSAKQPPHQQPAMLTTQGVPYTNAPARQPAMLTTQGVPYTNAPARHYSLAGFAPINLNTRSYHNNFNPYYPWDAFRRPGYY